MTTQSEAQKAYFDEQGYRYESAAARLVGRREVCARNENLAFYYQFNYREEAIRAYLQAYDEQEKLDHSKTHAAGVVAAQRAGGWGRLTDAISGRPG